MKKVDTNVKALQATSRYLNEYDKKLQIDKHNL